MTSVQLGLIRCLVAAALFGATAPAASELAGEIPAFALAGLLYLGAAAFVTPTVARHPPSRQALVSEWRPAAAAVLAGGAVGPLLLVAGLARTSAATASLLLNVELVATVLLAGLLFGEHLGRRVLIAASLFTIAGVVLTWRPGASVDAGALLIAAACVCWGLDNCVTAGMEQLAPAHVVALKGSIAGAANLAIGLAGAGLGDGIGVGHVVAALCVGALGYGLSITLWVSGARDLGAARGQVIFAAAPFIGAVVAWTVLSEPAARYQLVAVALAVVGVAISLRSAHDHAHQHEQLEHDHEHRHDDGHHSHHHAHHADGECADHEHAQQRRAGVGQAANGNERHSHPHVHAPLVHSHVHVPDLHHRHRH